MTLQSRLGWGWLARRDDLSRDAIDGVRLRGDLPTRFEEFTFVRDVLGEGSERLVLDAATGFEPGVHIMPEILARAGWNVIAVDLMDPMISGAFGKPFEPHTRIFRHRGNVTHTPYRTGIFHAWICISVFEHMTPEDQVRTLYEATRLTRPRGLLVLTMDGIDPSDIATYLSPHWDVGEDLGGPDGPHLDPKVSYLVAQRKAV